MRRRLLAVGLAAPLALVLTSCSSSSQTVSGQGGSGSPAASHTSSSPAPSSSPSSSSSSSSSSSGGSNTARDTLVAKLGEGLRAAKTAHLTLNLVAAGHRIAGGGDEKLSNGKLVALDLTETVEANFRLSIVIVGNKTYLKLPAQENHSGKPWTLVRPGSSNPAVRAFASSLASTRSSASLSSITAFAAAARTVKQTKSGSGTTTYFVDVDPSRLPSDYPGKQALIASGLTSLPITMTLDSQGRPTRITEKFTVDGQKIDTTITVGAYNKPVHIVAPPAKQVSTK